MEIMNEYRDFWQQAFNTALNALLMKEHLPEYRSGRDVHYKGIIDEAYDIANMALEAYELKRDDLREKNLKAFE